MLDQWLNDVIQIFRITCWNMIGLFPQKMETDFDWVIWQFDSSASILFGLPAFLHNSRSGIQRVHGTGSGGESSGRPSWCHQPFLRQSPPTLASHHPHRRSPFHRWNSYLTPNCVNNSIPYWNCSSDLDLSICCLCYGIFWGLGIVHHYDLN